MIIATALFGCGGAVINKVETKENITEVKSIYTRIEKEYSFFYSIDGNQSKETILNQSVDIIISKIRDKLSVA